jgi:HlyD family secretion protein
VPPERVLQYIERVKTGIRGIGYVRLDDSVEWPERLNRQLPGPGSTSAATSALQPAAKESSAAPSEAHAATPPTQEKAATPKAADGSSPNRN